MTKSGGVLIRRGKIGGRERKCWGESLGRGGVSSSVVA